MKKYKLGISEGSLIFFIWIQRFNLVLQTLNLTIYVNKIRNPPLALPPIGNKEESDDLEGQRIEKIIIPSNIFDIWTRLEKLLGLKLIEHIDTSTAASSLVDEI